VLFLFVCGSSEVDDFHFVVQGFGPHLLEPLLSLLQLVVRGDSCITIDLRKGNSWVALGFFHPSRATVGFVEGLLVGKLGII